MSGAGNCTVEGCQGQFRLSTPATPVCRSCHIKGYRGYPPKLKEDKMSDKTFYRLLGIFILLVVIAKVLH